VVLLKSVLPLEVYAYEEFYTRLSFNTFEMSKASFFDYKTHFTVMNYQGGDVKPTKLLYQDFEQQFDEDHGKDSWGKARENIERALGDIFKAFQVKHMNDLAKEGKYAAGLQRAMYGVDVMITEEFEPRILEITFQPDCHRACEFNPDFFNEVFQCLFLNESKRMRRIV